jgi:hypothetical protein
MPTTTATRLYKILFTRTDRATLPAGSAIGFSLTVDATDLQHAEALAAERVARSHDPGLLFVERVFDVTP